MSSYLDHLPSYEREKVRKRLRNPEEYERLRQNVTGPEELKQALERSEKMAELHFSLESEPAMRQSLTERIQEDVQDQGIESIVDGEPSPEMKQLIEEGKFSVAIEAHPDSHEDVVMIVPEGNIQEKLPITQTMSEKYAAQMMQS